MDLQILISYRREDSSGYAHALYNRLSKQYGEGRVFMDVDAIEPGQDFVEALEGSVQACDVVIALIGRRWVDAKDEDGQRRLEDPNDFLRIEIQTALERGVRVIPVLVQGARMPRVAELPEDLGKLARRQALELSDTRFNMDVDRLIHSLDQFASRRSQPSAPPSPPSPPETPPSPELVEPTIAAPIPREQPVAPPTAAHTPEALPKKRKNPALLKALGAHILLGFGPFYQGGRFRGLLYPLACSCAFIVLALAENHVEPFDSELGLQSFLICGGLYTLGFLDVIVTWFFRRRKQKRSRPA